MKLNTKVLVLSAAMALAACGGGGDDSDSNAGAGGGASQGNAKPLGLTNYGDIAEEVVDSLAAGDLLGSFLPAQVSVSTSGLAGLASGDAATVVQSALREITKPGRQKVRIAAVESYNDTCLGGGSVSITENDADNNGVLSGGDSASLVLRNCRFESGLPAVNGRIDIRINSAQLDRNDEIVSGSFRMTVTNLEAEGERLNGAIDVTLNASSLVLSFQGLTLTDDDGINRYNFIQTLGLNDNSLSVNGDLVIDGTSYRLSTPVTLRSGSTYFSSGTLRIEDQNKGYADVVMSRFSYTVNLYLPGDLVVDATKTVAW